MPFAGYADFAECVRRNQDKRDPEAYCAAIKRQVERAAKRPKASELLTKPHPLFRKRQ